MVHSEARTRLDNLTKIQSSNAWISSWNAQMLHFPLCRESVLGMPRLGIEFEFDMVFCFGIRLAPCAVFYIRTNRKFCPFSSIFISAPRHRFSASPIFTVTFLGITEALVTSTAGWISLLYLQAKTAIRTMATLLLVIKVICDSFDIISLNDNVSKLWNITISPVYAFLLQPLKL